MPFNEDYLNEKEVRTFWKTCRIFTNTVYNYIESVLVRSGEPATLQSIGSTYIRYVLNNCRFGADYETNDTTAHMRVKNMPDTVINHMKESGFSVVESINLFKNNRYTFSFNRHLHNYQKNANDDNVVFDYLPLVRSKHKATFDVDGVGWDVCAIYVNEVSFRPENLINLIYRRNEIFELIYERGSAHKLVEVINELHNKNTKFYFDDKNLELFMELFMVLGYTVLKRDNVLILENK